MLLTIVLINIENEGTHFGGIEMYVCVCHAVTERQVREAVQQGVSSMRGLREQLGVASECGRCARCAHGILKECKNCSRQTDALDCAA
jgi:bacterioferritin-associated ferredoxin